VFFRTEAQIVRALEGLGETRASVEAWEYAGALDGTVVARHSGIARPGHWVSRVIPTWFSPAHGWLLWISQTGIFPSMELLQIYYTMRAAHGDRDDLMTAPGHQFLAYEKGHLQAFLFLVISFGWDAHLITYGGPGRAFFSHDGWFRFSLDDHLLPKAFEDLKASNIEYG
jgi:hypothetical protein